MAPPGELEGGRAEDQLARLEHLRQHARRDAGRPQRGVAPLHQLDEALGGLPALFQHAADLDGVLGLGMAAQERGEQHGREAVAVAQHERVRKVEGGEDEQVRPDAADHLVQALAGGDQPLPGAGMEGAGVEGCRCDPRPRRAGAGRGAEGLAQGLQGPARKEVLEDGHEGEALRAHGIAAVRETQVDDLVAPRRQPPGEPEGRVQMPLLMLDQEGDPGHGARE
jgi:hypothetical protein